MTAVQREEEEEEEVQLPGDGHVTVEESAVEGEGVFKEQRLIHQRLMESRSPYLCYTSLACMFSLSIPRCWNLEETERMNSISTQLSMVCLVGTAQWWRRKETDSG